MPHYYRVLAAVVLSSLCSAGVAQQTVPPVKREIIPGSELMTTEEREEYRRRFAGAKSSEAQELVRTEHRQRIRERARLRGLRLADDPPSTAGAKP